jgi:hypothetical protein
VIVAERNSVEACKAVASSFAGEIAVAIMGSWLGTFDAAFTKQIVAIEGPTTVVEDFAHLLIIIG